MSGEAARAHILVLEVIITQCGQSLIVLYDMIEFSFKMLYLLVQFFGAAGHCNKHLTCPHLN